MIGSRFEASYERMEEGAGGDLQAIIPTLRGSAHVCAEATLLLSEDDPFAWGIRAA